MADAMCGPSNPLQNLQKQTSVDRTLQQDRLTSRQSPSQGFRSQQGLNGALDPEFEAFQAGLPASPPLELQHFPQNHLNHIPGPSFAGPSQQAPGWASDFQRLQISSPPPLTQQQPFRQHNTSPASWHQDFMQQQASPVARQAPQSAMSPMYNQMSGFGGSAYAPQSFYGQQGMAQSPIASGKQKEHDMVFDDAAFERAFNAAHAEVMAEAEVTMEEALQMEDQKPSLDGGIESSTTTTNHLSAQEAVEAVDHASIRTDVPEARFVDQEIIQGPIHELPREEQQQEQKPQQEDHQDELAKTAGQLLESVSDNTSQKFQQSQFLALMRKLRDREVRVEGDKMVEGL